MNGQKLTYLVLMLGLMAGTAGAATLHVSEPTQVTSDAYYERGQAITYDGLNYWMFYGRSASETGSYSGSGNPDVSDYVIYYKKATSVVDLADAAATAVAVSGSHVSDSYLGEMGAAVFDSKVWVFATIYDGASHTDLYGYYTVDDGTTWTQVGPIVADMSSGQGHHDAIVFNGDLWIVEGSGNFTTLHSSTPENPASFSTPLAVGSLTGGLCHFFVDDDGSPDPSLYLALGSSGSYYIYLYNDVQTQWDLVDQKSISGYYDPTLFKVDDSYAFYCAPYAGGRQWIVGWTAAALNGDFFDGSEHAVIDGRYGDNVWVDMWPIGYTDEEGDTYLFYTSERNPEDPTADEIAGNIWVVAVEWDLGDDHFTFIQEAIDAATVEDEILIADGRYCESNITVDKSLTVRGQSRAGVVIAPHAEDVGLGTSSFDGSYQHGFMVTAHDVTLRDMTIDGTANNISAGGHLPDQNNYRIGILNYADGDEGYDGLTVDNVVLQHIRRRGISIWPTNTANHVVSNCLIADVDVHQAISCSGAPAVITGNTISQTGMGISLTPNLPPDSGVQLTVTDNVLFDIAGSFSEHYGHSYPSVGIYYRNPNYDQTLLCMGNELTIGAGAEAEGLPGVTGMYLYNCDASSVIQNNSIDATGGTANWGIYLGGCAGATVDANTFALNERDSGIFLGRGSAGDPVPNVISRNVFTSTGSNSTGISEGCALVQGNHGDLFWMAEDPQNTDNLILNNQIDGFVNGVLFHSDGVSSWTVEGTLEGNSVTNCSALAVDASTLNDPVAASGNYWGVVNPEEMAGLFAQVDYTPWLSLGTDTSSDPGFQGDFSELWVDADSPQTEPIGRIQEAVDMVTGSTVHVLHGIYEEQVVITMDDLALIGAGSGDDPAFSTIIRSPVSLGYSFQTGTLNNYPVIGVDGCTGVSIENLRVDGYGRGNSNYRFQGIAFWNAGGDVENCAVVNIQETPFSGAQHGVGIYAYNSTGGPYTINVSDSYLDEFQKNALALSGEGLIANLSGCDIVGKGLIDVTAQNGIQIGFGAGGSISNTTVSGIGYTPADWAASGILLYHGEPVEISNASVTNSQSAIGSIETDATISGVTVIAGDVDSAEGIQLRDDGQRFNSETGLPVRSVSPFVEEGGRGAKERGAPTLVTVTGATLSGAMSADSYGLSVWGLGDDASMTVTNSTISNWEYGAVAYEDASTATLTANFCTISGNAGGFWSNTALPQNALSNWWGDATGPYHDNTNLGGQGNPVTDNVDFDPWIGMSGGENIVCIPDPLEIGLADDFGGGVYRNGLTVHYLGGGSGPMYSYSIDVEWDEAVVSATAASFTKPSAGPFATAPLFQVVGMEGNKVRIDAALGGTHPGTYGPDELFAAVFTAVGAPDYATSDVDVTIHDVRNNQNQSLDGFYADDGLIIVDLVEPSITDVLLTNDTLSHTDDYVKDTDQITLTATISDGGSVALTDITADLQGLGGGGAVNPDTYDSGVATWVLASVTCTPADGTVTVTVTAMDGVGNVSAGSDDIIADNTKPAALAGLMALPGHNKVELAWDDASSSDAHYDGVILRFARWNDYPNYSVTGPDYPATHLEGIGTAFEGTGTAATHTFDPADRDIYYYAGFVYDIARNYSDPSGAGENQDRSTNYWLGDVNGDGEVFTADISALGGTYYRSQGESGFDANCDVGPTDDGGRLGIPEPDDMVDFEDLMIFSMNFGVVGPAMAPYGDPEAASISSVGLSLMMPDPISLGAEFRVIVHLEDESAAVQGARFVVAHDPQVVEFLGASEGALSGELEHSFFMAIPRDGGLQRNLADVSVAAIGAGETLGGSGQLAVLRYRCTGNGPVSLTLTEVYARNVLNQELLPETMDAEFGEDAAATIPEVAFLSASRPNPVTSHAAIRFGLAADGMVRLVVYDATGRVVRVLADGPRTAGEHLVNWDRCAADGSQVAGGIYFYRLEANDRTMTRKMVISR